MREGEEEKVGGVWGRRRNNKLWWGFEREIEKKNPIRTTNGKRRTDSKIKSDIMIHNDTNIRMRKNKKTE